MDNNTYGLCPLFQFNIRVLPHNDIPDEICRKCKTGEFLRGKLHKF